MKGLINKATTDKVLAVRADLDYKKMQKVQLFFTIFFAVICIIFAVMLKELWWISLIVLALVLAVVGIIGVFVNSVKKATQLPKQAVTYNGDKTFGLVTEDGSFKINFKDILSITAKETNLFFIRMDCGTITIKTIHMDFKLKYIAKANQTTDYLNYLVEINKG